MNGDSLAETHHLHPCTEFFSPPLPSENLVVLGTGHLITAHPYLQLLRVVEQRPDEMVMADMEAVKSSAEET